MLEQVTMPKYKCHKTVSALKITALKDSKAGIAMWFEEKAAFPPILLESAISQRFSFKDKKGEIDLGYYIVYADGYQSWSPTKAFESGYKRI